MNRRKFFGFVAAAPVAVAAMPPAGLASGGMVMGHAAGRLHAIGEGGPEAIVPLRRMETLSIKIDDGSLAKVKREIEAHFHKFQGEVARLHTPDASQTFRDGDGI